MARGILELPPLNGIQQRTHCKPPVDHFGAPFEWGGVSVAGANAQGAARSAPARCGRMPGTISRGARDVVRESQILKVLEGGYRRIQSGESSILHLRLVSKSSRGSAHGTAPTMREGVGWTPSRSGFWYHINSHSQLQPPGHVPLPDSASSSLSRASTALPIASPRTPL